jgi:phosphoribosylcarboxyaminoimidazole (NCAIR) mutase
MAIGKSGARNAAIFAAQIIAVADTELRHKLEAYKQEMARQVEQKAEKIKSMA